MKKLTQYSIPCAEEGDALTRKNKLVGVLPCSKVKVCGGAVRSRTYHLPCKLNNYKVGCTLGGRTGMIHLPLDDAQSNPVNISVGRNFYNYRARQRPL